MKQKQHGEGGVADTARAAGVPKSLGTGPGVWSRTPEHGDRDGGDAAFRPDRPDSTEAGNGDGAADLAEVKAANLARARREHALEVRKYWGWAPPEVEKDLAVEMEAVAPDPVEPSPPEGGVPQAAGAARGTARRTSWHVGPGPKRPRPGQRTQPHRTRPASSDADSAGGPTGSQGTAIREAAAVHVPAVTPALDQTAGEMPKPTQTAENSSASGESTPVDRGAAQDQRRVDSDKTEAVEEDGWAFKPSAKPRRRMPDSPKRRAANKRNAAKSTGPKTEEGKRNSSMNAVKNGLWARTKWAITNGLNPEDSHDVEAFVQNIVQDLDPRSAPENACAHRIAHRELQLWRGVSRDLTLRESAAYGGGGGLPYLEHLESSTERARELLHLVLWLAAADPDLEDRLVADDRFGKSVQVLKPNDRDLVQPTAEYLVRVLVRRHVRSRISNDPRPATAQEWEHELRRLFSVGFPSSTAALDWTLNLLWTDGLDVWAMQRQLAVATAELEEELTDVHERRVLQLERQLERQYAAYYRMRGQPPISQWE